MRLQTAFSVATLLLALPAAAQNCGPDWKPFGSGTNDAIFDSIEFDDGSGMALYVAGRFTQIGGQPIARVARWNGMSWEPLGAGLDDRVFELEVHDDGTGPALYAGGLFRNSGATPVSSIAKWDGQAWGPVGSGVVGGVNCLATFDDGTGPALYIGGSLSAAGNPQRGAILRWDGATYSQVPGELFENFGGRGSAWCFEVFDDGSGPALYVGGAFHQVGNLPASHLAKWDGTAWSIPGGFDGGGSVEDLLVYDLGQGPKLAATGLFHLVGGVAMYNITSWDGTVWQALNLGMRDPFFAMGRDLAQYDDGTGPALYVAGSFDLIGQVQASGVARWDGATWSAMPGMEASSLTTYFSLSAYQDPGGSGPRLFLGSGGQPHPVTAENGVSSWGGCAWGPVGENHCTAAPNSSGLSGYLQGYGASLASRNALRLQAGDLPAQTMAYAIVSQNASFVPNPGGAAGNLCLGGAIGRFNRASQIQITGAQGAMELQADLLEIPTPLGTQTVMAGDTWHFQVWFRDFQGGATTSNFTDALQVDFQ